MTEAWACSPSSRQRRAAASNAEVFIVFELHATRMCRSGGTPSSRAVLGLRVTNELGVSKRDVNFDGPAMHSQSLSRLQ
jgi:hypothetical protein